MGAESRSPTLAGVSRPNDDAGSNGGLPETVTPSQRSAVQVQIDKNEAMDASSEKGKVAAEQSEFEVQFTGDDDPRSPKCKSTLRRWIIVAIMSTSSLCVACGSSLYTGTYGQVIEEFHVSETVTVLGLSLFVLGLSISPMILAPLSEFYGRKPIYVGSLICFIIWIIPSAVARNMQTMLAARFFDGFAGAPFLSVAGGTVGDIFPKSKLAAPMAVYALSPFLGPQFGPLIAGFINYNVNWRWTFWVLMIWSGVQLCLVFFFVPETYAPVLLRREARRLRKETGDERYYAPLEKMDRSVLQTVFRSLYRPFILLTVEPMCLLLCLYTALILGIVYLFFGAFALVFTNNHGFNLWQVGLSFLGISIGMTLGACTTPLWNQNHRKLLAQHETRTGSPGSEPEYRLPPAIFGAGCVTVGLLWFGWTTYSSIHWIVPILGSVVFGVGALLSFSGIWTFLVENYPTYAASALAANSFARSVFAACFPLFGNAMYTRLGYQWATFLLAMISLVMLPFPYIFFRHGKWFRSKSRYSGLR